MAQIYPASQTKKNIKKLLLQRSRKRLWALILFSTVIMTIVSTVCCMGNREGCREQPSLHKTFLAGII